MRRLGKRGAVAIAVAAVVAVLAGAITAAALTGGSGGARGSAMPGWPSPAATANCPDPGTATPVVFVHGLNGSPADFTAHGTGGVARAVSALPGVAVSYFDYQAQASQWVTDPHIGPALAQDVACLGARSAADGGPGKVVVIAHSMGALALRDAAAATVGGRSVAGRIELAVTIAAPNTGSWIDGVVNGTAETIDQYLGAHSPVAEQLVRHALSELATACGPSGSRPGGALCGIVQKPASPGARALVPGSPELAALPVLPAQVRRFAVAGDIHLTGTIPAVGPLPGATLAVPLAVGDWLVKPDSALAEAGSPASGGGSFTANCTVNISSLLSPQVLATAGWTGCAHGGLLYDPPVTAAVVTAVRAVLHR